MTTTTAPKGPPGRFPFGSLADFQRDQLAFYTACARDYGDVVAASFGPRRVVLIYHPDAIEEVLVTRARDFVKSRGTRMLRPLLGNGLLLAEGESWLRQRRLMQPAFHRQRLAGYADTMSGYTERTVAGWREGQTIDLHAELMRLTQSIVAKALFDADVSDRAHAVLDAANVLAEDLGQRLKRFNVLPRWVPTPANVRADRAIRRLDEVVLRIIAERRASDEDRGDLLSILLQAQDADDGTRMTDRQVRDEVMTLFLAGHETTAVALTWAWYLLAQHPEAERRLGDELRAVLGGRTPTLADVPRLTYADHVVTEAMRLYPPAYAMGREAINATEVAGVPLARGMIVAIPTWTVHRDPRWFDAPDAFRPERWDDERVRALPRFAYFPFGGGPRQCIGNAFATMEAVLLLATIAQRFRLALEPGPPVTPTPYVTLRPEPAPRMRLIAR
jgi:cytochrome P450